MLSAYTLFSVQLIAHISFFVLIALGEVHQWLIAIFVYFLTGCLGMTMTYHRLLSHQSWKAPSWFKYIGTLCATIGLTGSAISWVAIHRKHHRFADKPNDPHSPHHKSFIFCQWLSMFEKVELKYITELARNKFLIYQHKYYFFISLAYATVLYAIDPFAVVYAWLAPACILWNAGSSIVTISHLFGTKDHDTRDHSKNNWLLGLLVWGEGWHNNHHNSPSSPFYGEKWWQIDIGGYLIKLLQKKTYK